MGCVDYQYFGGKNYLIGVGNWFGEIGLYLSGLGIVMLF